MQQKGELAVWSFFRPLSDRPERKANRKWGAELAGKVTGWLEWSNDHPTFVTILNIYKSYFVSVLNLTVGTDELTQGLNKFIVRGSNAINVSAGTKKKTLAAAVSKQHNVSQTSIHLLHHHNVNIIFHFCGYLGPCCCTGTVPGCLSCWQSNISNKSFPNSLTDW